MCNPNLIANAGRMMMQSGANTSAMGQGSGGIPAQIPPGVGASTAGPSGTPVIQGAPPNVASLAQGGPGNGPGGPVMQAPPQQPQMPPQLPPAVPGAAHVPPAHPGAPMPPPGAVARMVAGMGRPNGRGALPSR